ncbi:MAG: PaaI family thioesterase [Limnochordaceae bacterium]|nr:PaaI family thioesterase [Limnochordaceae bacterium]
MFSDLIGAQRLPGPPGSGQAAMELVVDDRHRNVMGIVHGGVIMTLCDEALGLAVFTLLGEEEKAVTAEFKVNFLHPVLQGRLRATAQVVHQGHHLVVGRSELRDDAGQLLAIGQGTYFVA